MKYISLLTMLACTKHIHHKDMLNVKPGMTYDQVVQEIGLPNKLSNTQPMEVSPGEFKTVQIYVWKSHENSNDWMKDCYFSFVDGNLVIVKC